MENAESQHNRRRTLVLFHTHPEQEQKWTRTATRELAGIPRDERKTGSGLLWAGWKGYVVRWLGWVGTLEACQLAVCLCSLSS